MREITLEKWTFQLLIDSIHYDSLTNNERRGTHGTGKKRGTS
jgi:hypothetical protein